MSQPERFLQRRYPGLKPFERSQSPLFYGRQEDVVRLSNLILRERLVVLFAKSGIGKTSLLQAGAAPQLEGKGFLPIFLRADNTKRSISERVAEVLRTHPMASNFDHTDEGAKDMGAMELWELSKRLQFDIDGLPATPVLVVDQFEELFTLGHSAANRQQFINNLADLVNETMPGSIRSALLERVQARDPQLTTSIMEWWEKLPDLRVVISIRSDFLHLLDEISPQVPSILKNRYQLQALNRKQATDAIAFPSDAKGKFASEPFSYAPEAITDMVDFLSGTDAENAQDNLTLLRREEIESFNLQILCQFIEEKIIDEKRPAGFVVTPDFFGGKQGMENEIRDFYAKQLSSLPLAYTRRTGNKVDDPADIIATAQRLIEESLVTPIGRRCSMVDDFLTATWNVSADFLDTLVDTRLVRKELRLDDYYYEISHDTLLPAILESRDARRKKEKADQEKAALQEQLKEEEKRREAVEQELKSVREKRMLARKVSILSLVSFVLALLFGLWFMNNWVGSIKEDYEQAEQNFRSEFFESALLTYDNLAASPLKSAVLNRILHKKASESAADARRFMVLYDRFSETLDVGDSLFFQKNYAAALTGYRQTSQILTQYRQMNYAMLGKNGIETWRINPAKITEKERMLSLRIESTVNTLVDQFKISQRDFETFKEAGVWGQALRNLHDMQSLLPEGDDDVALLQKALNLKNVSPKDYVETEIRKCQANLF